MDCIINISKNEESEQMLNRIAEINNEINENTLKNKQEFINKINDEFNTINKNFRNMEKEYLEKFYNKNIDKYTYNNDEKFWILNKLGDYLDDPESFMLDKYLFNPKNE